METQVISLETVASEIFQIIRSFDYTTVMYDDDGNEVYEPNEARRFFILPRNMLLSLIDDGDDSSIKLYLSKSTKAKYIKGFIDTLRTTATKDNMIWLVTQKDTELKPSDFATKSAVNESRKTKMDIFEGMYGTSRSSYLTLENAKLIVRHGGKINENSVGGRSRNIKKIFIENSQGERMLFPTRQLIPARAELQHVNQGGNFNDAISQQIMRMANDFSNLSIASTEIASAAPMLGESAMSIREACRCKMTEMKKCFERLSRPFGYKMESKKMSETVLTENEEQSLDISPLKEVLTCEGFELSEIILRSVAEAVKSVAEGLTAGTPIQRPDQSEEDYLASLEEPTYLRREKAAKAAQDALGGGPKLRTVKDEPSDINEAEPELTNNEVVREFNEWMEQFDVSNVLSENDIDEARLFKPLKGHQYHTYTNGQLKYVIQDAHEAAQAMKDHDPKAEAKYLDQMNDAHTILGYRNHGGKQETGIENPKHWSNVEESSLEESEPYEGEEELQDAQVEATDDFDVNDFLNDYGDELYWDQGKFDTSGLTDDDLKFEKSYVKTLIQHYLEARVYDKTGQDVDMKEFVQYVWDKVEPLLTDAGHILTEFADGSLTFSHTDIIIPTNQGDDLDREVTKPSSTDPFTGQEVPVDDAYITRMRTLAGMPWNR